LFHLVSKSAGFGQVRFDERSMAPGDFTKRMQSFDHSGALCPTAPGARSQRDNRNFSVAQSPQAELEMVILSFFRRFEQASSLRTL